MSATINPDTTVRFNPNVFEPDETIPKDEDEIELECKYCFDQTTNATGKLVRACHCKAYVHQQCIRRAIDSCEPHLRRCTVCLYDYNVVPAGEIDWEELIAPKYITMSIIAVMTFVCITFLPVTLLYITIMLMSWGVSVVLIIFVSLYFFVRKQRSKDYLVVAKKRFFKPVDV